jgi:hypothetical protein
MAQDIRMKNPAHPGGFVKTEIIEPLGLSVTDAAQVLGITRAALDLFERARNPFARHGDTDSKGFRRVDGYAHADAEQLRHRPSPQAGRGNQGSALCGQGQDRPVT